MNGMTHLLALGVRWKGWGFAILLYTRASFMGGGGGKGGYFPLARIMPTLGTCEHCMSCESKTSDPHPPSFLTVNFCPLDNFSKWTLVMGGNGEYSNFFFILTEVNQKTQQHMKFKLQLWLHMHSSYVVIKTMCASWQQSYIRMM